MKSYYSHAGIQIFHGDCREILPQLPPRCAQCDVALMDESITAIHIAAGHPIEPGFGVIVCDPPYGRDVELSSRGNGRRITGDHNTDLRDWIVGLPASKLVFGSPFVPPPSCQAKLVWDKSELTGMGDLGFPWKATHEEIYVMGGGFKSRRRRGSVLRYPLRPSWSNHPDAVSGLHPNEKPVGLMVDLIECCPWMGIIDPTCGSGATLQAAKKLGKLAIGIDTEEKYCELSAKRLSQEVFSFEGGDLNF